MMRRGNFTEDFRSDAIKQITERGRSVAGVSEFGWRQPAEH